EFFRAIDAVKKRSQRSRKWGATSNDQIADHRDVQERRLTDDREVVRLAAHKHLNTHQQEILDLSFDGWSVHEIATKMKLSPARVSDEKYKAIRKLRESLASKV